MNLPPRPRNRAALRRACAALAAAWLFAAGAGDVRAPPAAAVRTYDLHVAARKLQKGPATIRMVRGERAVLRWTADEPMVIHVHGYDLTAAVRPGATAALPIAARFAGRFPVTAHLQPAGAQTRSGRAHREPTLLYLEVHPE